MPRKRKEIIRLIEQARLEKTSVLDLSGCNLGDLIGDVCRMNWLTELNLAHCHIVQLPDEIGNLTGLTRLDLSENQLDALPESLANLTALKSLNLTRAGYELKLSAEQEKWIDQVPELIWEDKPPRAEEKAAIAALALAVSEHPNLLLWRIESAMKLYNDAFNMEERGYSGTETRERADKEIERIFERFSEMKDLLPELYKDFKAHRFHGSNCESEKTINNNPFRLPTKADDEWLANLSGDSADLAPLKLICEATQINHSIFTLNELTKQKSKVFSAQYGDILVSNQPYAADEQYFADYEAKLFQAGVSRLFVRAEIYGYGGVSSIEWFDSNNGGDLWQPQPKLTYEWLENNFGSWHQLSFMPKR